MKSPAEMSRTQLEAAMQSAHKQAMRIIDALIADGRGHERSSETLQKTDALSLAYIANSNREQELFRERDRRMTYHGKLTPIKQATAA